MLPAPPRGVEAADGSHLFYVVGLARTLVAAASLQLRVNVPDDAQIFQQECLLRNTAIQRVLEFVRILEDGHFKFLDPIFGVSFFELCEQNS
jgi:hypothetical protein